jgi:hypothetical protein
MKAFWYNVNSGFLNSWSHESGGATIGKTIFTYDYIGEKKSSPEPAGQFQSNSLQTYMYLACWIDGNSSLFKWRSKSSSKGDNYKSAKIG